MERSNQGNNFPLGSIRDGVATYGDGWRDVIHQQHAVKINAAAHIDAAHMKTADYLRRAGATPADRAEWREFIERSRYGEQHEPAAMTTRPKNILSSRAGLRNTAQKSGRAASRQ